MVGNLKVEVFPYQSFKEKMALTKKLDGKGKIEVGDNYVCIYYTAPTNYKA